MSLTKSAWVLALGLWAGAAAADVSGLALRSGDARMLAFALTQDRPEGWQVAVAGLAAGEGLAGQALPVRVSLSPGLDWDDSINGGMTAKTVTLGGLVFAVDPESRAVAGLVPSLGLSVRKVVGLAPGTGITAAAGLGYGHALDADLAVIRLSGSVCATRDLGDWTFGDLCLRQETVRRELGQTRLASASVGVDHVWGGSGQVQDLGLRLTQEQSEGRGRALVALNWQVARAGLGLVSAGIEAGARPEGRLAAVARQSLALRGDLVGAPMGLVLEHRQEAGEVIFGTAREDQVWSITAERDLPHGLRVSLGYSRRSSSITGFGGGAVTFALDVAGFSF